jgi:hypothetical protein
MRTAILLVAFCLVGCDLDPFNLNQRRVRGPFILQRFETQLYYIHKEGEELAVGGGYLEGTVQEIGWTDSLVFARRYSTFRGDPDGWMILDVKGQSMSGPLSDAAFRERYPGVKTYSPQDAWEKL